MILPRISDGTPFVDRDELDGATISFGLGKGFLSDVPISDSSCLRSSVLIR
jgi:hypothetical protein